MVEIAEKIFLRFKEYLDKFSAEYILAFRVPYEKVFKMNLSPHDDPSL